MNRRGLKEVLFQEEPLNPAVLFLSSRLRI